MEQKELQSGEGVACRSQETRRDERCTCLATAGHRNEEVTFICVTSLGQGQAGSHKFIFEFDKV